LDCIWMFAHRLVDWFCGLFSGNFCARLFIIGVACQAVGTGNLQTMRGDAMNRLHE
jgi:hypothetical protein